MLDKKLKAEDMQLHFHFHDWDYRANDDGLISFDEIEKRTDVLFVLILKKEIPPAKQVEFLFLKST